MVCESPEYRLSDRNRPYLRTSYAQAEPKDPEYLEDVRTVTLKDMTATFVEPLLRERGFRYIFDGPRRSERSIHWQDFTCLLAAFAGRKRKEGDELIQLDCQRKWWVMTPASVDESGMFYILIGKDEVEKFRDVMAEVSRERVKQAMRRAAEERERI
jgi:hypothetical protein